MEIVLFWIILSFVAGAIGGNRKIGFAGAFFLSLLLSPLIGLIVAFASKRKDTEAFEKALIAKSKEHNQTDHIDRLFKLKSLLDSGAIDIETYNREKSVIDSDRIHDVYFFNSTGDKHHIIAAGMKGLVRVPKEKENAIPIRVKGKIFEIIVAKENPLFFKEKRYTIDAGDFSEKYVDLKDLIEN